MTDQTPLTDQQLAEYAALNSAATPGPWTVSEDYSDVLAPDGDQLASYWNPTSATRNGEFIAAARSAVPALLAEVRRLRAALEQIRHLHKDSPMGPCPVCIDADAAAAGGDGLMPYPCPTGRLAGAQDCEPPQQPDRPARLAHGYARGDDPYAESPDAGDDSACDCGGAWHARKQHCIDWPCPGCPRICQPEPGAPTA